MGTHLLPIFVCREAVRREVPESFGQSMRLYEDTFDQLNDEQMQAVNDADEVNLQQAIGRTITQFVTRDIRAVSANQRYWASRLALDTFINTNTNALPQEAWSPLRWYRSPNGTRHRKKAQLYLYTQSLVQLEAEVVKRRIEQERLFKPGTCMSSILIQTQQQRWSQFILTDHFRFTAYSQRGNITKEQTRRLKSLEVAWREYKSSRDKLGSDGADDRPPLLQKDLIFKGDLTELWATRLFNEPGASWTQLDTQKAIALYHRAQRTKEEQNYLTVQVRRLSAWLHDEPRYWRLRIADAEQAVMELESGQNGTNKTADDYVSSLGRLTCMELHSRLVRMIREHQKSFKVLASHASDPLYPIPLSSRLHYRTTNIAGMPRVTRPAVDVENEADAVEQLVLLAHGSEHDELELDGPAEIDLDAEDLLGGASETYWSLPVDDPDLLDSDGDGDGDGDGGGDGGGDG